MQASFDANQLEAIRGLLNDAIPKPSPKIVDLRFMVDFFFSRFYVVLFVGKDRRQQQRRYWAGRLTRVGNLIAAVMLLLAANLVISSFVVLFAYLLKSLVGIDLFPGHFQDYLKHLL
ncbi:MAG: hypothetical protein O2890_09450 [Cyanobacteria bacterium]|nr:hypothetical protein [Cyanobacteriota bacterium]